MEVVRDRALAWTLDRCVGTADDLYFVSADGRRFWVLFPLPALPAGKKRTAVLGAQVAVLYESSGKVLARKRLGAFLARSQAFRVQRLHRHFKWLEGAVGVRGKRPRLTEKNQVEFEDISAKTHRLGF